VLEFRFIDLDLPLRVDARRTWRTTILVALATELNGVAGSTWSATRRAEVTRTEVPFSLAWWAMIGL